MALHKRIHIRGSGSLANLLSYIEREEVARRDEAVDRLERNVIGVEEVRLVPAQFLDGSIGSLARLAGLGADDGVLTVGLVPHRNALYARLACLDASRQ